MAKTTLHKESEIPLLQIFISVAKQLKARYYARIRLITQYKKHYFADIY